MISYIKGILAEKSPARIVVEAGGIGYEVMIPVSSYDALGATGSTVLIHTHDHVREDSHELFGFATTKELWLFELLISVAGIGPRSAITIMSGTSVDSFCEAVAREEADALMAISGVGKKTAQRLIVELKNKVLERDIAAGPPGAPAAKDAVSEAVRALVSLGFPGHVARRAVEKCVAESRAELCVEELVKSALRHT